MSLSKILWRILYCGGLLIACSGRHGPKFEYQNKEGATVSCERGRNFLQAITPNIPVEFMELTDTLSAGEACKAATQQRSCKRIMRSIREERAAQRTLSLLVTSGHSIWSIGAKQINDFLSPIDSVEEAALVAYLYGAKVCYAEITREEGRFMIDVPAIPLDPSSHCRLLPTIHFVSVEGAFSSESQGMITCR